MMNFWHLSEHFSFLHHLILAFYMKSYSMSNWSGLDSCQWLHLMLFWGLSYLSFNFADLVGWGIFDWRFLIFSTLHMLFHSFHESWRSLLLIRYYSLCKRILLLSCSFKESISVFCYFHFDLSVSSCYSAWVCFNLHSLRLLDQCSLFPLWIGKVYTCYLFNQSLYPFSFASRITDGEIVSLVKNILDFLHFSQSLFYFVFFIDEVIDLQVHWFNSQLPLFCLRDLSALVSLFQFD